MTLFEIFECWANENNIKIITLELKANYHLVYINSMSIFIYSDFMSIHDTRNNIAKCFASAPQFFEKLERHIKYAD